MVFSTRQQLIFKCSWNLAYDDDETLNSFNEETFNSLQRLAYMAVPRLWFQNFFFFFDEKWNLPNQNWLSEKTSAWMKLKKAAKKLLSLPEKVLQR